MLYPFRFQPILAERVWGGQTLARYGKTIPAGKIIGESWEISDRPEAQSILDNGILAGKTLHELVQLLGRQLLGANNADTERFPLLIKLLDARDRLSLQVHPPASVAGSLRGEPKTEMWYILEAAPDSHLIAGLRRGVTRTQFEQALTQVPSPLANLVHRFPVKAGDALFVESGRLHAIDAGLVIAEIQQNSDTTYRVYDWDRVGLDGKPRTLHVKESLASIDFADFEPPPNQFPIECDHFRVEKINLTSAYTDCCDGSTFHIIGCVAGELLIETGKNQEILRLGDFALLPAALGDYTLRTMTSIASALKTTVPQFR